MYEIKKACVYTRVSTAEQAAEGYSIEEQERKCKAAIESKGWEYVRTYSDPGISGRTTDRPGLQSMFTAIAQKEVEAVFVYKLDRLSRKQKDTMAIIEDVLMKNDVALVSLNETLDTTTPWGRAMIGILSSFNQMESENIQMRTAMGREAKANKGGYAGGKPPIGYKAVNGQLVIVPEEAEVVRLVFDLRKKGGTYVSIAEELNNRGFTSKSGKKFHHSAVQNILNNENTYKGFYKYGKSGTNEKTHAPILDEE
ncbi:MAG: recombinase family protein [Oscillospiraceae bacterium]|nr:recombinase family protein [Oscillospiraceae bacterium]